MPHGWVWLRGARPLWLCRCWVQGAELGRLARIWVVGAVGSWQEQGLERFSLALSQRSWVWGTSNTERPHHAHPSPLLHPRCPLPWCRGAAWCSHWHRRQGERSRYVPAPPRTAGSRAVRGPPPAAQAGCHGLLWSPGDQPHDSRGHLCFSPGAGAFAGIPGECSLFPACPSLPFQASPSLLWPPHTKRCLRGFPSRGRGPGVPRAPPSRKVWWQPGQGLQVSVCCWLCRTGRLWRPAARSPSGVSHQSSQAPR